MKVQIKILTKRFKNEKTYDYFSGSKHKVDLRLYGHDPSISCHYGTFMMKVKKNHFSCDINSEIAPLFIEVLFASC